MRVLAEAGKSMTIDQAKALVEKMRADTATTGSALASASPSPEAPGEGCSLPIERPGMSGTDAALTLGPAKENNRFFKTENETQQIQTKRQHP